MNFEPVIARLTLVPSRDGRFEVTVDGHLVFSKATGGRHAREGEVVALVRPFAEAAEQLIREGF